MKVLIKNEFTKLKREWFVLFLLLLSWLPVLTGGVGAVFNNSTKTVSDLFFFMNNQFSMFFPMVIVILTGSLFYQEYKNKTYINWITYGYSKQQLFSAKIIVGFVIGIAFAASLICLFHILILMLKIAGKVSTDIQEILSLTVGFALEDIIVIVITTCIAAIIINISRNIIVTSIIGVIYGFVSCFFIGSEFGYVIPGSFAYRLSMYFSDSSTYYELAKQATIGGCISSIISFGVMFFVGIFIFTRKKKIES
ncbi:ABC transporter permease [Clostridioides difficile]|nr:ABC transporter permease [Clostridioides difficile]